MILSGNLDRLDRSNSGPEIYGAGCKNFIYTLSAGFSSGDLAGSEAWQASGSHHLPDVVFALRLGLLIKQKHSSPQLKKVSLVVGVIALVMFAASLTFRKLDLLLFYPVMVSTVMFTVFFSSLFSRQSLVELIARLQYPDLNERGVAYTGRVTEIWCVFFILNGCVALYTCTRDSMEWWVWYNGLISYILMGLLRGIEYLFRRRLLASLKS